MGGWNGARSTAAAVALGVAAWLSSPLSAQRGGMFLGFADDPAIAYSTAPVSNVVDALNRQLQDGATTLAFSGRSGYLQSTLDALRLTPDSQLLVHSAASLQGRLIGPANPRALFFDDRVAVAWVRDGDVLEIAAHDDRSGVVFYTLEQKATERPLFKREFRCLGCHQTGDTLGIPGFLMFSMTPDSTGDRAMKIAATDQRNPIAERFGGWFVTGGGSARHQGNEVPALDQRRGRPLASVAGLFDAEGYRAATSDMAALLTFSHQTHMANLLTRASWEARAADPALHPQVARDDRAGAPESRRVAAGPGQMQHVETLMRGIAEEVVDYMLFVDEAPLANAVSTRSPFAERMSARGPRDRMGRSLYMLDLSTRLLTYPCSYLIYSPAFDALPPLAKTPIFRRLWEVLSGEVSDARYRTLSRSTRQAIVEILKDTKRDLPDYFATVTK